MIRMMTLILVAAMGVAAVGQDPDEPKKDARFEKIKALKGDWVAVGREDKGVVVSYRVSAAGTAVFETIFVGQPHEMVSVYTMDGGELLMTHYCALGNQPRMKAGELKDGVLSFAYTKVVENTKSHDENHIHGLKMTFGEGTLQHDWSSLKDGKESEVTTISLVRKK